jgi:putative DNA primase/helicase
VAAELPSATTFSELQRDVLARRAIDVETAWLAGVTSVADEAELAQQEPGAPAYWTVENGYLPGLLFRYVAPSSAGRAGAVELQLRPDTPVVNGKGDVAKYVFAKGAASLIHSARPDDLAPDVLVVEGTCQAIAAARYAPEGWAVYGIAGCQSWMKAGVPADLAVVDGRRVFIVLDADAATNRAVYDAGRKLGDACRMNGAREVRFVRLPAGGKAGLDDVLGGAPAERRGRLLEGLIRTTEDLRRAEKPEEPARRRPDAKAKGPDQDGTGSPWFDADGGLLVQELAGAIRDEHHALLARDDTVAVYRDGVYVIDKLAIRGAISDRLGDNYSTGRRANVEEFLVAELARLGERLPEYADRPLVNFRNGMLDLETGELLAHDPKYGSTHQLTVDWSPDADAPLFDRWVLESAGSQVSALLEAASVFLDPSVTPTRALFLFGPARSGKSTFLRLLEALVGPSFVAGVSLHALSDDHFAAANLYGKVLNVDADVKAADVRDLSLFKKLTGEDVITANRKYGAQFEFRNRALFAFSANELPSVGENSRAYVARIAPFLFGRSFDGAIDPTLEPRLREELAGIAARLVRAWQERRARGRDLGADPRVVELFETASDRVRQWVTDRCELVIGTQGQPAFAATVSELHQGFRAWASDAGAAELGRKNFAQRLAGVPGAVEVKDGATGRRGWNVRIRPENSWSDGSVQDVYQAVMAGVEVTGEHGTAVTAVSAHPATTGDGIHSDAQERTFEDMTVENTYRPQPRQDRAETAVTAVAPEDRTSVILKGIQALAPTKGRSCTRCGTPEVLVDGHWFACPRCHPRTARTDIQEAP